MRCLTLADSLAKCSNATCAFVCRKHSGNLIQEINKRGYEVKSLEQRVCPANSREEDIRLYHADWLGTDWQQDAADTISALNGIHYDWVVVDHYAIDQRWEQRLRAHCNRLMVIDDLADRYHDCDLLIDQNWFSDATASRYDKYISPIAIKLLGPQYALLGPEYCLLRTWLPERDGLVRRVLVFLGGSDFTDQTSKVLHSLMEPDLAFLAVDVVVGANHPSPHHVAELAAQRPGTVLHRNLPTLAGLISRADLMIGAGGTTSWERMSLGLPSIVISIATNQTLPSQALMLDGYIEYIGERTTVEKSHISNAVRKSMTSPALLREQSKKMKNLVSAEGAISVCSHLSALHQDRYSA